MNRKPMQSGQSSRKRKKSDMKMYRNSALLFVGVLVMVAAYIWLLPLIAAEEEEPSRGPQPNLEEVQLMQLPVESIVHMHIDNNGYIFDFSFEDVTIVSENGEQRTTKQWVMNEPKGYNDLDPFAIRGIATHFADLRSLRIIEENPQDLTKYGLDNPSSITVTTNTGDTHVVKIGDRAPLVAAKYARVNDDPTVYSIRSYNADRIVPNIHALRSIAIFDFQKEDVVGFNMNRGGQPLFQSDRTTEDLWHVHYPVSADAKSEHIIELLESIMSLYKAEFVEEFPEDLGEYGLTNPYYEFELYTADGRSKTVHLGREHRADNAFYARFDDSDEVFKVPSFGLRYIDRPLTDIIQLFCFIVNYKHVDELVVEIQGEEKQTSNLMHGETISEDAFYVNGKRIDMRDEDGRHVWRMYYQSIIGVLLTQIDLEAEPEGEPEVRFTYHLNDGRGIVTVEFVPMGDDHNYYCMIDGEYTGMIVNRRSFYGRDGVMTRFNYMMDHYYQENE